MEESLTISKKLPALKSMQYKTLRELGLEHIKELAGKIWTDYNTHDPGVTILEVLSYVITDLGYRVNYPIIDILAQNTNDPEYAEIKNFYTAGQILPNCPVTVNDFRKLMMDVEVVEEGVSENETIYAGVKNSWIQKSPDAEQEIYVNNSISVLSLDEVPGVTTQDSYFVKGLFDVLLEFDETDEFGDLNSNTIEEDLVIYDHSSDHSIDGLIFAIKIEFPRWDDEEVDWNDPVNIQKNINRISVKIYELPDNYEMKAIVSNLNEVILTGTKDIGGTITNIDGLDVLMTAIHEFIYDSSDGLLQLYLQKVNKIHEIVDEVRATLHANRNLCDDFYRFHALKIEEILVCADIELQPASDIDQVEARIFKAISDFLSPQVNFYTLQEMLDKCKNTPQYKIQEIQKTKNVLTLKQKLKEDFNNDDTITLIDSGKNDGEYTVKCIRENKENVNYTDIEVVEDITTGKFDNGAYLIRGKIDESSCLTVDEIFEGPLLKHGFIDEDELNAAKRRKVIHVSDLIRIMMDVEGVVAVKSIQIANRPLDNDENIESKSVKWCLDLAMAENYVPRLSIDDSKITYYKGQLPFLADRQEVESFIDELKNKDRSQKIRYPVTDIPIPQGEFMDIENYTSLQEDFPLTYGIGFEGIPGLNSLEGADRKIRQAEVYQLKEYLLFFDQLLANYLSQLSHVKDLFSMNGEKNQFGQYLIDRTYFTQPLYDVVSDADPLYVDKGGHAVALQQLTEDQQLYEKRRNKFLDHLLGRFAETFTDYAMLTFKMSGSKSAAELIEDKLKFLNEYPELSSTRGKGFDYLDPCEIWHLDNISGLEKRVSLLSGIEEKTANDLNFSKNFVFVVPAIAGDSYKLQMENDASDTLFVANSFVSENVARLAAEKIIINGVCREKYQLIENGGTYSVELRCNAELLLTSEQSNLTIANAELLIYEIIQIMEREYYNNPESNRNNLACPLRNYFHVEVLPDMTPVAPDPPTYTVTYTLYNKAFDFASGTVLLTGSVTEDATLGDSQTTVSKKGHKRIYDVLWEVINNGMERKHYITDPAVAPYSSPYSFIIVNRFGKEIARSIEIDFNDRIAAEAISLTSGIVTVSGSTDNDGDYIVSGASAEGPFVKIQVSPVPILPKFDGQLSWTESFAIIAVDRTNRTLEIGHDLSSVLCKGDLITVSESESNDGDYTILKLEVNGSNTRVYVKENIPSENISGNLTYSKSFEIASLQTDSFIIRGGEDEQAIQDMINFIGENFFSHEGMHVIEHLLLRPKINEPLFVEILSQVLQDGLPANGDLYFKKSTNIVATSVANNSVTIGGNILAEIIDNNISIEGGSFNDGNYIVDQKSFNGINTILTLKSDTSVILYDLPDVEGNPPGIIKFTKKAAIDTVSASLNQIVITDSDASTLSEGEIIEIKNSIDGTNDFRFKVLSVTVNGSDIEIIVSQIEQLFQDDLLPIHLDQNCESCQIKDPYSFVVSVVLPYWPDRFINMDYRNFMEMTLRKEAPAHVLLNICWIDCRQMTELETKLKVWLTETGKTKVDKVALSKSLSELIDILTKIRNVYPTGTLHDCEENENLEEAIILNNSVLGTF